MAGEKKLNSVVSLYRKLVEEKKGAEVNIILNDNDHVAEGLDDFRMVLERETGKSWAWADWVSNQPRTSTLSEIRRYGKYILYPLSLVFRKDIETICSWQQFYAVSYAYFSRLFRRPKTARVTAMTFIYKPKSGIVGRLFEGYVRYAVTSGFIDRITCTSSGECEAYAAYFGLPREMFSFVPWAIPDYTREFAAVRSEGFVLGSGRSNRDWRYLMDELDGTEYEAKIIDDTLSGVEAPANVEVLTNVAGAGFRDLLSRCWVFVLPIDDPRISAGQTVLLHAWAFGKPVICTKSRGLTDDYVRDGEDGIVVEKKSGAVLSALQRLAQDKELYEKLSRNGRKKYLENYTHEALGMHVAETFQ